MLLLSLVVRVVRSRVVIERRIRLSVCVVGLVCECECCSQWSLTQVQRLGAVVRPPKIVVTIQSSCRHHLDMIMVYSQSCNNCDGFKKIYILEDRVKDEK